MAAASVFVATSVVALAWLLKASWSAARGRLLSELSLLCVTVPGLMFLVMQNGLYATGLGYILLKSIDYSTFLLPILIAVAAETPLNKFVWQRHRILAAVAIAAVWFPVVVSEKSKILGRYRDDIVAMPKFEDYVIPNGGLPPGIQVIPDFDREVLNLFLYANRFGSDRIIAAAAASNRFQFVNLEKRGAPVVARLTHTGIAGHPIADITGKKAQSRY